MVQYSFVGKNALVPGSSKGIGRAVALALAKGGANVVVNCSGSRAQAEEVAAEIRALGRKSYVAVCDVSDQSAVEAMVAGVVQELGSLDMFVSNAVYSDRELMVNAKMEGFRRTIEVSMWGAMYGVRAAAQQMLKQESRGRITVISSPHAIIPFPTAMAYNMAKAGLTALSESLMIETAGTGVVVLDVRPGDYRTDFEGSVTRLPGSRSPRAARAWKAFEAMMRSGPPPAHAAASLRRALLRNRSGTVRTGRFFQATLAPLLTRLSPLALSRRIQAGYFEIGRAHV